jgi:hypothetical protein
MIGCASVQEAMVVDDLGAPEAIDHGERNEPATLDVSFGVVDAPLLVLGARLVFQRLRR